MGVTFGLARRVIEGVWGKHLLWLSNRAQTSSLLDACQTWRRDTIPSFAMSGVLSIMAPPSTRMQRAP
jgi:hypothetical protein